MAGIRVLHTLAGAQHGGAEQAFVDMCVAQKQHGEIDLHVACRPSPRDKQLTAAGITPLHLPFGGRLDIYTSWRLRRYIAQHKPQIVQTWMSRAAWHTPWPGANTPTFAKVSRLGGYYKLKYFRGTTHFTTITPDIQRYLTEQGIDPANISHINNFAETEKAAAPLNRADFSTPDEAFVFLSLSRLHTAKGLDTLLNALVDVPNAYLWLAGDGPELPALKAQAHERHIQHRVRFLGWRDDRAALLQACNAVVFPSRYEPFGTTFVQAWAAQRPLVCTAAQGCKQYVRHGADGLMVAVDDTAALAAAMRQVMQEDTTTMVQTAYQRYQAEFSCQTIVAQYLDLYRRLCP